MVPETNFHIRYFFLIFKTSDYIQFQIKNTTNTDTVPISHTL